MSLFNKMMGVDSTLNNGSKLPWHFLEHLSELKTIEQLSNEKPIILFKHSTRCSISRMALKQFENEYTIESGKAKLYFLDLLNHRDISNKIAVQFNVIHQSPQILLVKNGKCIYTASHDEISALVLSSYIE